MNTLSGFKTPSRLMAGIVSLILLALYGAVLLAPIFWPDVKFSESLTTTLQNLTILAVGYYLGSSDGSANKDETIQTQATSAAVKGGSVGSTASPVAVKIDDSTPVAVDVKEGALPDRVNTHI